MTEKLLTDELAARVLGSRLMPGRYIKSGPSCLLRSRFWPPIDLRDTFTPLDSAITPCWLLAVLGGVLTSQVRMASLIRNLTADLTTCQPLGIQLEAKC